MKTDKFDEAIRRKLESIEPAFRERDWGHMQSFMHRHGYPPAWTGAPQWLMPVAAAAAITGLLLSTIWQFRTNQELRQSIQTLSQTVARLETTQSKLIQSQSKTDTVYVTTFTQPNAPNPIAATQPVPASRPTNEATDAVPAQAKQPANTTFPASDRVAANGASRTQSTADASRPGFPPTRQPADGTTMPIEAPIANASTADPNRTGALATTEPKTDRTSRPGNGRLPLRNPAPDSKPSGNYTGNGTISNTANVVTDYSGQRLNRQQTARQRLAGTQNTGRGAGGNPIQPGNSAGQSENQRSGQVSVSPLPETDGQMTRQTATLPALAGRPLQLDSAAYIEGIARRIRRIRSLFPATPTTPVAQAMPTETAGNHPLSAGVRIRLGVAGEIGTKQTVAGLYSEILGGRHWAVGVGLDKVVVQGGQFATDEQFDDRTKHDFRKEYAPGIDPRHDILDINRQLTVWQVPISLSYRVPLSQGFAVVPSVGVNVALSAQGNITFMYRRGPREFYTATVPPSSPPRELFTNYVVATALEKSWRHVVLQAGPVLTTPAKKLPDPVNPVSLSLRARILFQF